MLAHATSHLDLYRRGLEYGTTHRLGNEAHNGRPALKVHSIQGGDEHIAYLDPETLYPLAERFLNGIERVISYPTLETLRQADAPADVFEVSLPPADLNTTYDQLSTEDLTQFTAYPVVNLGVAFQGYTLDVVERFKVQANGHLETEKVYSIYRKRNARGEEENELQVLAYHLLRLGQNPEVDARTEELLPPPELVMINGESARLRLYTADGEHGTETQVTLEIERSETFIVILASDRDTALAAGAALQSAMAAPDLIPPPVIPAQ